MKAPQTEPPAVPDEEGEFTREEGHFKCNLRRIADYPALGAYLRDLYQWPGVADTVNLDHIKRHYYRTQTDLNPGRIVPLGPLLDLGAPHGRDGPIPPA